MVPVGLDLGPGAGQGRAGCAGHRPGYQQGVCDVLVVEKGCQELPCVYSPHNCYCRTLTMEERRNFDACIECRNKKFNLPWGLKPALYLANFASSSS